MAHRAWTTILLVCGLVMPSLLGLSWDDYSPARDYLSELGAYGSPVQVWARWAAFAPVGVAALACAWLLRSNAELRWPAAIVGLGLAIGYLGAALIPCDLGCPVDGASPRQQAHNLLGLVQYALCALGLLLAALRLTGSARALSGLALLGVVVGFALMLSTPLSGLWQRIADFSILLWLFWATRLQPARLKTTGRKA